ncbi:MAG: peroxiredoxin-like family protein [Pseudomonadota bacterium]
MIVRAVFVSIAIFFSSIVLASSSLVEKQQRLVDKINANRSEDVRALNNRGIQEIRNSGILNKAVNVGDYAPEFDLPNALGERVSLYDSLENGPVVLVWYRGGWCPYCNLQLQQIQARLKEIEDAGGQVIAISPELPDMSMSTKEKNELQFEVLSDIDNRVADLYHLAYKVPDYVVDHYDLSVTLNSHNGNDNKRLPLAVTYVIDREGVVQYAFLDADYKNRASAQDIITELNEIKE